MTNKIVVAINTAPRAEEYLPALLDNLATVAGIGDLPLVMLNSQEGTSVDCQTLLRTVARDYPDYDVILLEDDILGCKNAIAALAAFTLPEGCGLLSAFNCRERFTESGQTVEVGDVDYAQGYRHRDLPVRRGVYFRPVESGFLFAQAVKLPAKVVAHIAFSETFRDENGHRDLQLGKAVGECGYKFTCLVVPNWFQHVGKASAWDGESPRAALIESGNWVGIEHDALEDLDLCGSLKYNRC